MKSATIITGLSLVVGVAALTSPAGAAFIGPLDFESSGQEPVKGTNWASDITFERLDSATTPTDPFGPSGNHSFMIQDGSTSQAAQAEWWNKTDPGLTRGTFKTQIMTQLDSGYMRIRLGNNTSTSNSGTIPSNGRAIELNGGSSLSLNGVALDNTWTKNEAHTVVLNFDVPAHTVSGTLDGDPLKAGTQETFTLMNGYAPGANDPQTIINGIEIISGYISNDQSRTIIDNMSMSAVPEPATLSILGLGGLGLLMWRRK